VVKRIQADPDAAQVYIDNVLKAGSSRPPVDILKSAGIDMTTPQPIRDTVAAMDDIMDQIETILAK
jgi:oligoendopeptidase F